MIRALLILFIALFSTAFRSPTADGVVGTWKRTTMLLVEANGKTSDLAQTMQRSMPCTKDITYTFMGNGRLKTTIPDACGKLKRTVESMNVDSRWSIRGRTLTVTTTMKGFPPATYDVVFQGATMTWVFSYADNPRTPNPTKAQRLTIVYQRMY